VFDVALSGATVIAPMFTLKLSRKSACAKGVAIRVAATKDDFNTFLIILLRCYE
jgi:hypothetical protein